MLCYVNNKSKYPSDGPEIERGKCDTDELCVTFQLNNCQSYQTCMSWEVGGGGTTVYERSRGKNIAQRCKQETDCSSKVL